MRAVDSATGTPIIGNCIPALRNYQNSLSILLIISLIAILISAIARKETFAKSIPENTDLTIVST